MGKAEEIAALLKKKILAGAFDEKLPSEKELSQIFHAAPNTAGKAVRLLAEEGLVVRVHGSGTFLRLPEMRVVKVKAFDFFFNTLQEVCAADFPEVRFQKVQNMEEADLVTVTSFFPSDYCTSLDAMPEGIWDIIAGDPRFYPRLLELHRRGRVCYGIPAFFSPVILACNRKILEKIAAPFAPYELTFATLKQLLAKAAQHGFCGIDPGFFSINFLTGLIANMPLPLNREVLQESCRLLEEFLPFFSRGSFNENKALFYLTSRHLLRMAPIPDNVPFDIMPFPGFSVDSRRCDIASEALAVNLQACGKERLWKIVLTTLKAPFQQKVAAARYGIPLDRTLAVDTLDSSSYRDDIFFSEIKHLDFTRSRIPFPVMREIFLEYDNVMRNKMTVDEFRGRIDRTFERYEYEISRSKEYSW